MICCKTCNTIQAMLLRWNSWKTIKMSLLLHSIYGIVWSFTSTPVRFGQGMVDLWCWKSAHSEMTQVNVSQKRPWLAKPVCVCHPCHKKKGFCHWRPKQHTRGIASDPSEGLRQYSFFAWCDALGKRFIDLRPTLRCGVSKAEIKATRNTRKTYLGFTQKGSLRQSWICFSCAGKSKPSLIPV